MIGGEKVVTFRMLGSIWEVAAESLVSDLIVLYVQLTGQLVER